MTTASASTTRTRTGRTPVQTVSLIVGIVFLLVGIAGFIPGLTTDYGSMSFAGMNSMAMLLGVFQVSVLHNIVHLLFGVVGVAASRRARSSKLFLIIGGIVYAVLWLYGLVIDMSSNANFVPLNTADNWLHLVLAVGMILLGIVVPGVRRTADDNAR
jgi:arginine exporter protein ArgO